MNATHILSVAVTYVDAYSLASAVVSINNFITVASRFFGM